MTSQTATMTKYHVTEETDLNKLADNVERLMTQGWQPIGGIEVFRQNGVGYETRFYQAMAK